MFDFVPSLVVLNMPYVTHCRLILVHGTTEVQTNQDFPNTSMNNFITWSGASVSWYNNGEGAWAQLNAQGQTTYYVALG